MAKGNSDVPNIDRPFIIPLSNMAFHEMKFPPREYIIDPWLPKGGAMMIYGQAGIGKTFFALTLAICIGGGKAPFSIDHFSIPKKRKVLYIDGEMDGAELQARHRGIHLGLRLNPADVDLDIDCLTYEMERRSRNPFSFKLNDPQTQQDLTNLITTGEKDYKVIFVDNIGCLVEGDENKAESWDVILKWILEMRSRGIAIVFLHHTSKSGSQRGHSKKVDVLNTVISLSGVEYADLTEGTDINVKFEKNRGFGGIAAEDFIAVLNVNNENGAVTWIIKESEESRINKIFKLKGQGFTQDQIAEKLNISQTTVNRALKNNR